MKYAVICKNLRMYIQVEDLVVDAEVYSKKFVCDLQACKGACCIEGNSGAPITFEEIDQLEEDLDQIKPYMRDEGINAVEKQGVFYMDVENEPVTTLVNNKECAFVFFDEQGITKCAIEKAFKEGKTSLKKPISCHLYPIRIKKFNETKALVFETWDICSPACSCGEQLDVPVYRFLKEPIERAFGKPFFQSLLESHSALLQSGVLTK